MSTQTNEAIRIACAEAMGYQWYTTYMEKSGHRLKRPTGRRTLFLPKQAQSYLLCELCHDMRIPVEDLNRSGAVPNYPEDDKAARELRESLNRMEIPHFISHLQSILNIQSYGHGITVFAPWEILNASPRDQAIAFLKVKGVTL